MVLSLLLLSLSCLSPSLFSNSPSDEHFLMVSYHFLGITISSRRVQNGRGPSLPCSSSSSSSSRLLTSLLLLLFLLLFSCRPFSSIYPPLHLHLYSYSYSCFLFFLLSSFVNLVDIKGLEPTVFTYTTVINACVRGGEVER